MIRSHPAAVVRVVYVGGPWDGREEELEVPGGIPRSSPLTSRSAATCATGPCPMAAGGCSGGGST
jgi:hypothetical protein